MGLLTPPPAPVGAEEWERLGHLERVRVMSEVWAERGAETPIYILLFYVAKLALYVLGAFLVIAATPGMGGFSDLSEWWSEPDHR